MKATLALLGGFVLTLAAFSGGAILATAVITAKPVDERKLEMNQGALWTAQAQPVDGTTQELERLPAVNPPSAAVASEKTSVATADAGADPAASVDPMNTAAIEPDGGEPMSDSSPQMDPHHVEWCADRYRSYRPRDNSYTPYSGGRRECVSPFTVATGGSAPRVSPQQAWDSYTDDTVDAAPDGLAYAEVAEDGTMEEHIRSCFSRYRSYRVEDNTYQPYGGGPRRPCLP